MKRFVNGPDISVEHCAGILNRLLLRSSTAALGGGVACALIRRDPARDSCDGAWKGKLGPGGLIRLVLNDAMVDIGDTPGTPCSPVAGPVAKRPVPAMRSGSLRDE